MMDSPFYIVLSSSAKNGHFSVKLPYSLFFPYTEKWKVCLVELSLACSLNNITKDFIIFKDIDSEIKVEIPDGYYSTLGDLQLAIERSADAYQLPETFRIPSLNAQKNRLVISVKPNQYIILSENLANLLGMEKSNANLIFFNRKPLTVKSNIINTTFSGATQVFVYINVIEERILRDNMTKLLTFVTLEHNKLGGVVTSAPLPREYLPVRPGVYSEIEMKFELADGKSVNFNKGVVLVKLEFIRL